MTVLYGTNGAIRTGGIRQLRAGSKRITKAYYGDVLIYDQPFVVLTFYFDRTNINPRGKFGGQSNQPTMVGAEWLSTSDPHVWKVITPVYRCGVSNTDYTMGLGQLFSKDNGGVLLVGALGTCQVTDITGDIGRITNLDRTFAGCTAITSISQTFYDRFSGSTALTNVGSMCNGCTGITDGSSLYGYGVFSTQCPNCTVHPATFDHADSAANLAQIPTSWGGTMAPPATLLNCTKYNAAGWTVNTSDPDCPDFTTVTELEVFTTSSISAYTGVNMRKSDIWNRRNGFSADASSTTYYYPAFIQGTGNWPGGTGSSYAPTWVFAPDMYNGMLPSGSTTGDMPGVLDYDAYGPFSTKYGSFDSAKTTYFCFVVFNTDSAIASFNPSSTPFAIHSNKNFRDMTLNWFIPD